MTEPSPAEDTATAPATQAPRKFNPFAATRAILASRTLATAERLVALAIVSHADRAGTAFPGRALLAAETNLSIRGLAKALRGLEKAGVLRWTQRSTKAGDRDTNLYEVLLAEGWAVGNSVPYGREVSSLGEELTSRPGGELSAHKHLPEKHPTGTTQVKEGERQPPPHPSTGLKKVEVEDTETKDWIVVLTEHQRLRAENYGTAGPDEPVPAENRRAVVKYLGALADRIRAEWNAIPGCSTSRDDALRHLARGLLVEWFASEGHDEYLTRRAHPLRALRDDLTTLVTEWWPSWEEHVARTTAERTPRVAS